MKLINKDEFIANEIKFYLLKNKTKEGEKLPCHRFCSGNTVSEHKMSVHHIREYHGADKGDRICYKIADLICGAEKLKRYVSREKRDQHENIVQHHIDDGRCTAEYDIVDKLLVSEVQIFNFRNHTYRPLYNAHDVRYFR